MGRTETKYCYMLAIVLCFTGCQPSESSIEKAISLTKAEWTSVPSPSPYPTYTRMATVPEELTEPSVGTSVAVSTENTIGAVTQYGSPTLMLPTATPTETRISTVTSTVVATNSDYQSMAVEDPVIKVSGAVAVNIRSGPGLNYSKIGLAKPGTTATITGKTNNDEWYQINYEGSSAWVAASVVEVTSSTTTISIVDDIPTPPATSVPVAAITGFNLGGQAIHGGLLAIDKMQSIGMRWVKLQNYDLSGATLDGDVQNAHANGLSILISVKDNAGHQLIADPGYQEQFIQYLERVARTGADAIEVWNEPNLDREWPANQMGGAQYTALLQKAYPRIKAANANTMVISAALSPTGAFSGSCGYAGSTYGCDDKPFLQAMVNAGALNYLDCVGMHYNEGLLPPSATSGDPRGNGGHYTRYFKGMIDTYNAILGSAKPICITELGYLSGEEWGYLPSQFSWSPPINMTVAQHADYLGQAVTLSRQMGTIRLLIIFNVDFAVLKSLDDDPQAGYSIVRPSGACPACQTLAAAMN
jgi:uncharacterized protein YraI